MADELDLIGAQEQAREDALEGLIDSTLRAKAKIIRPIGGVEMPMEERVEAERRFLTDIDYARSVLDETRSRFKLGPDQVPLRFVYSALMAIEVVEKADAKSSNGVTGT